MESNINYICEDCELLTSALMDTVLNQDQIELLSDMYREATNEHKRIFRTVFEDELCEYHDEIFNG